MALPLPPRIEEKTRFGVCRPGEALEVLKPEPDAAIRWRADVDGRGAADVDVSAAVLLREPQHGVQPANGGNRPAAVVVTRRRTPLSPHCRPIRRQQLVQARGGRRCGR